MATKINTAMTKAPPASSMRGACLASMYAPNCCGEREPVTTPGLERKIAPLNPAPLTAATSTPTLSYAPTAALNTV